MKDRSASGTRVASWRERLRRHDYVAFRDAVRNQPSLALDEMAAFDEAVSNPYPQAHPCYRLLAAHTAAWYEAVQDHPHLPRSFDRTGRQRRLAVYAVAPELGVNAATLDRALSGTAPMQRETARRLYATLAEQGALKPENFDDEIIAELWRRTTRKSVPLSVHGFAPHSARLSESTYRADATAEAR